MHCKTKKRRPWNNRGNTEDYLVIIKKINELKEDNTKMENQVMQTQK